MLLHTIMALLLAGSLRAQEEFVDPARRLTRFGFRQLTGGVILLEAKLHPHPDTLNFILDTGSGGISLDSVTVDYLGLKKVPSGRTIRGIAGMRSVSFVYDRQLQLPGLNVDSLNFHVNDYSILSSVYGQQIDGIIGYSVLSRYIVKINYDSSWVEFWTQGALKYPRGGYLLKPFISTLPVHGARVRDEATVNSRFLYDMGAGLCLMLSTDFLRDSSLMKRHRKLYAKQAEGLGGKVDMSLTVVKEFKLGPYRFRNVPTYVFDDTYNITSYPYLGGLIGNDLLRRFNVILNYEKRDFHLTPNLHFHEPFDYSYSGIELYQINGEILIGDVAKSSPAELAGLKEDDVIVGINKAIGQDLQHYKQALQVAGERVHMIIRRNGELMEFYFRVKSIL